MRVSVELSPVLLVCPLVGATIGFNLTRRYKSPPETALINIREGQMELAIPTIYSQADFFDGMTPRVDLVKVKF